LLKRPYGLLKTSDRSFANPVSIIPSKLELPQTTRLDPSILDRDIQHVAGPGDQLLCHQICRVIGGVDVVYISRQQLVHVAHGLDGDGIMCDCATVADLLE
jgi:hypothetical protein